MILPPRGTVAEACRRATRPCHQRCSPTTIPHGGRDLTPWDAAAVGFQKINERTKNFEKYTYAAVRHMYISRNFWFFHLFFENYIYTEPNREITDR
jgi:hypothetical protein